MERKTTPKFKTLRPYTMTVTDVSESSIFEETGETEGFLNAKLTQDQAGLLVEIITKQRKKNAGFVEFSLKGKLR